MTDLNLSDISDTTESRGRVTVPNPHTRKPHLIARGQVVTLFWSGIGAILVAALLFFIGLHDEPFALMLGFLVAGLAQISLFIAIVAWGVRLGVQSAEPQP